MNKITSIEELPKSNLYQKFFKKNEFLKNYLSEEHPIFNSKLKGAESKNSCVFVIDKSETEQMEILKEIFNLSDSFAEKYCESISGGGHEYRKISTLHSSSLLALLCFYSVSDEHKIRININGVECTFNNVQFEVRKSYANIDVVLYGENDKKESVVLFLESKFTEYLTQKSYTASNYYNDIYENLKPIKGLTIAKDCQTGEWHVSSECIKQMISHYVGIRRKYKEIIKDYQHVYLGEIVFKFPDEVYDGGVDFSSYGEMYNQLARQLHARNEGINVLPKLLTYQDIFSNQNPDFLDENVETFYQL